MKASRVKNVGCTVILLPWLLMVVYALATGEPDDPATAAFIGQFISFWPLVGAVVSWIGSGLHMLFGLWDSDPTPEQEFIHKRRAQSFKMFAGLSAVIIGLVIAFMGRSQIDAGQTGMIVMPALCAGPGLFVFIVFFWNSLHVDAWTLAEQEHIASQLPGIYGK